MPGDKRNENQLCFFLRIQTGDKPTLRLTVEKMMFVLVIYLTCASMAHGDPLPWQQFANNTLKKGNVGKCRHDRRQRLLRDQEHTSDCS